MSIRKGDALIAGVPDTSNLADKNLSNLSATGNAKVLPAQSGQSGKFLTTNGSAASWATVVTPSDNTTQYKVWTGTKAQYDAIVTKDANTLYNTTDEGGNVLQNVLETIWPVGSYYFGEMAVCPLAALFGTWQLVGTKILTDVSGSDTVPVKGNGMTLGLRTSESELFGMTTADYNRQLMGSNTSAYGQDAGGSYGTRSGDGTHKSIGVTTDETKSGIVADISSSLTKTDLTVNVFRRTA